VSLSVEKGLVIRKVFMKGDEGEKAVRSKLIAFKAVTRIEKPTNIR